jgi:transcriptional regulator with XRE-family HTH domain
VEYWAEWRSAAIGELPMNSDQARHIRPARAPAERVPAERALVAARSGPTALRIALGAQLRRLREDSHVTVVDAAEAIRATHSKISRLERGRSGAKQRDVADLLTLYGVTDDAQREELLVLARQANTPGWWQPYNDVLPSWFELYLGLEKAASIIRLYEVQFVHGLLQTEDYARAVILIANAHAPAEEIERRVSVRMKRQQLLTQPDAPQVWAVLDEAALRRWPAGPAEMRAQLEHLLEVTELPNVTLQVVPFDIGPHAAAGGPFTILRFPEPDLPDMVYLEQLNSAVYLDHPDDVIDYVTVMDQLCVRARTGPDSKDMISALLKQI